MNKHSSTEKRMCTPHLPFRAFFCISQPPANCIEVEEKRTQPQTEETTVNH